MSVTAAFRTTINVSGMTCAHCTAAVTKEIAAIAGVLDVDVELDSGMVTISSERALAPAELAAAVDEAGYQVAS